MAFLINMFEDEKGKEEITSLIKISGKGRVIYMVNQYFLKD